MNFFRAMMVGPGIARDMDLPVLKVILGILAQPRKVTTLMHMASAFGKIKAATEQGDYDKKGVQVIGQCCGLVHDMPSAKEVMDRTIGEAMEIYESMGMVIRE